MQKAWVTLGLEKQLKTKPFADILKEIEAGTKANMIKAPASAEDEYFNMQVTLWNKTFAKSGEATFKQIYGVCPGE